MKRADYQLRHGMLGRVGTMWSRQVDEPTRSKARTVTEAAGCAGLLRTTDAIAQHATGGRSVLVDDVYFRFVDGEFAIIGRSQSDYIHVNSPTVMAIRDPSPQLHAAPFGPPISRDDGFLATVAGAELRLPPGFDWYLIPIPEGVTPIVIEGVGGVMLVSGIDFSAHRGFIATRLSPARTFPHGMVRIVAAQLELPQMHSFLLGAPVDRLCSKYLIEYAKKTQSLKAFRKAAAEYCGMFVFPAHDIVLSVAEIRTPDSVIYVMASLGVLRIDYAHTRLAVGAVISAGTIVSGEFRIITESTSSPVGVLDVVRASGATVSLDGILPVKGLSAPVTQRVLLDHVETDSISGTPHTRIHLDGPQQALDELWARQRAHELATGDFLYDQFFTQPQAARELSLGDIVASYYGPQLSVLLYADLSSAMEGRLLQFVREHKPAGCVLLTACAPSGLA